MFLRVLNRFCKLCVGTLLLGAPVAGALSGASWNGTLSDGSGKPVAAAVVKLHSAAGGRDYTATTAPNGRFTFAEIAKGGYEVSVKLADKEWKAGPPLLVKDRDLTMALETSPVGQELRITSTAGEASAQASGGEHLSSAEVSSLPLNARDFSKLLLLAAGTMTDANGAANFT
jgi:Carboxypeptidase regulatory-like domain